MNEARHEHAPKAENPGSHRPARWPLLIWLLFYPVAGAYGGWKGADFIGWDSALLALGLGVAGTSVSVAISWFRFPVRNEDGSLYLRSLLAVVITNGLIGGLFVALFFWLMALVVSGFISRLVGDWGSEFTRACIGGVFTSLLGVLVAWKMRRKPG